MEHTIVCDAEKLSGDIVSRISASRAHKVQAFEYKRRDLQRLGRNVSDKNHLAVDLRNDVLRLFILTFNDQIGKKEYLVQLLGIYGEHVAM